MKTDHASIATSRCVSQHLAQPEFRTAKELTAWMGAIQAQDYAMVKWAIGIRLRNKTESSINSEIDSGNIIRTHLLRPTWHFVSADDIYWILDLTAPRIRAILRSSDRSLELTGAVYSKTNRILERSLRDGNHLIREDIITEFKKSGINISENRASHILMRAELDGLICSGKQKSGKASYAILGERVPVQKRLSRQEALKELGRRYFTSHGPATIHDFSWWSGLTLADAKSAVQYNNDILKSFSAENKTFWMSDTRLNKKIRPRDILFLPAYDEFLISYRDRTASLSFASNRKVISNNGMFYPVIVQKGQVIGTWKRSIVNKKLTVTRSLFGSAGQFEEKDFITGLKRYSSFTGMELLTV